VSLSAVRPSVRPSVRFHWSTHRPIELSRPDLARLNLPAVRPSVRPSVRRSVGRSVASGSLISLPPPPLSTFLPFFLSLFFLFLSFFFLFLFLFFFLPHNRRHESFYAKQCARYRAAVLDGFGVRRFLCRRPIQRDAVLFICQAPLQPSPDTAPRLFYVPPRGIKRDSPPPTAGAAGASPR